MANTFHDLYVGHNNHPITANPLDLPYADTAERDADTAFQVTANIDKVVKVTSPLSYWVLASVGPTVWAEFSSTTNDTLTEILANGNTSGGSDIVMSANDNISLLGGCY